MMIQVIPFSVIWSHFGQIFQEAKHIGEGSTFHIMSWIAYKVRGKHFGSMEAGKLETYLPINQRLGSHDKHQHDACWRGKEIVCMSTALAETMFDWDCDIFIKRKIYFICVCINLCMGTHMYPYEYSTMTAALDAVQFMNHRDHTFWLYTPFHQQPSLAEIPLMLVISLHVTNIWLYTASSWR